MSSKGVTLHFQVNVRDGEQHNTNGDTIEVGVENKALCEVPKVQIVGNKPVHSNRNIMNPKKGTVVATADRVKGVRNVELEVQAINQDGDLCIVNEDVIEVGNGNKSLLMAKVQTIQKGKMKNTNKKHVQVGNGNGKNINTTKDMFGEKGYKTCQKLMDYGSKAINKICVVFNPTSDRYRKPIQIGNGKEKWENDSNN